MALSKLVINHVRNIQRAQIIPHPRLNIIYGTNASGKTSLLEAVQILGTARSFRTARINQAIQWSAPCMTISGRLDARPEVQMGVERCQGKTRIRVNHQNVNQASALVRQLPVYLITPESHHILDQGPRPRRQLLDWGVFHVKPAYLAQVKAYMRVLRQRNAALRDEHNPDLARSFDPVLIQAAEKVDQARQDYVAALAPKITEIMEKLSGETITVHYQQGWRAGEPLQTVLKAQLERDVSKRHTQSGPHRADLLFKTQGIAIQTAFSRGQHKMLVCALRLAQLQHYHEQTGQHAVVLVDDLAAELDQAHRQQLLSLLMASEAQIFITLTEKNLLDTAKYPQHKMFHVKQGVITEENTRQAEEV